MKLRTSLLLLAVSVFLQLSTTIPFVIGILLLWYIQERNERVFVAAFLVGLFIDGILFNRVGISSLVFVIILSLAYAYERKFEIVTKEFVFLWTFLGGLSYLALLGHEYIVQQALVSSVFTVLLFQVNNVILNKVKNLGS